MACECLHDGLRVLPGRNWAAAAEIQAQETRGWRIRDAGTDGRHYIVNVKSVLDILASSEQFNGAILNGETTKAVDEAICLSCPVQAGQAENYHL